jgi:predicted secreted protein
LRRAAFNQPAPKMRGFASYLQEIEADAFAGAFLLPLWLITHHARKQGWSRTALAQEDVVYQLALRCGASFQATVWALDRHQIISAEDRDRLLNVKPKSIKARLGHSRPIAETRADAWKLSLGDVGSDIAVIVGDTVTIALEQQAAGGFLWDYHDGISNLANVGTEVALDRTAVGAPTVRSFLFRAIAPGAAEVTFEHKRPWEGQPIERAAFKVFVFEAEQGLSRANRARLIEQGRVRRAASAD